MKKSLTAVLTLIGISSMLALSGCAKKAQPEVAQEKVSFPEMNDAWAKDGIYVNLENLRKMHKGLSKNQVSSLLGRPHFGEGLLWVNKWNYILQLPKGDGSYQACQYQVQYDKDTRTQAMYWRDQSCAALVDGEAKPVEKISLSAQALFEFDSARLTRRGQHDIAEVSERLKSKFNGYSLTVTGYTDRLGDDSYNQTLSEQRAAAVRDGLIREGISSSAIKSKGAGKSHTADCQQHQSSAALKACLAPDRRVDIEIFNLQSNQR